MQLQQEIPRDDDVFRARRHDLVESLVASGLLRTPRVVAAFEQVPRHAFVPLELQHEAYWDQPVLIGNEQTISQPTVVAVMTEALELTGDERVLEIGTGSGYQCAILCALAREVYTIERIEPLARRAERVLARLGYAPHIRVGDGSAGWIEAAPFDAILLTASPPSLPVALLDQLAEGGRFVAPIGDPGGAQELVHLHRLGDRLVRRHLGGVRFVPMLSDTR